MSRIAAGLFCLASLAAGATLDNSIKSEAARQHLPGTALTVVKDGNVVYKFAGGEADQKTHQPMTWDTAFKIGSISKQFLASAVVLLASEGKLTLDDPITKYLPGAPPTWNAISIRRVLSHTGGFEREPPAFNPALSQPDFELIQRAYGTPLPYPPGEHWSYSNLGYNIAAEIITRCAGEPWPQYVTTRIFKPLGMSSTVLTNAANHPSRTAQGYDLQGLRLIAHRPTVAVRPAGAFLSTLPDLVRWDTALYTDSPLKRAAREQLWTPVALRNGESTDYGLGWHIETRAGHFCTVHRGRLGGFDAFLARFPNDHLSVIAFTNVSPTHLDKIGWAAAAHWLPGVDTEVTAH